MGLLRRVNRIHWRGLNAFTMGQIMKKVNSNTLVLTATNLLLAMTLTSVVMLVFFKTLFNRAADQAMPYTYVVLYLSPDDPLDRFDQAARSNPQNPPLRQMAFTRFASDVEVKTLLLPADQAANESALWPSKGTCAAMALSAYNALRAAKSLSPVALADGELAIQTGSWSAAFTDQLNRSLQQGLRVPFQGASYAIRQVLAQPINSLLLPSACTLVIPDALAGELPRAGAVTTLLYDYANPKDTLVERNLEQTIYAIGHGYWESLSERRASELVRQTIIMFAGLYLEMILLMACATVLGLQQLIETVESAQHYQTLRHLGAGESTLRRSISQQVTFYFFAPAGLAILHSLFALGAFEKTFGSFVALSPWALLGSLALFLAVYGAYYLITLRSCVNLTRPCQSKSAIPKTKRRRAHLPSSPAGEAAPVLPPSQ
ncbi:MAG: hypothetical protein M1546_06670, partial [Chloroflexi bacterium]|nr:hypothetical protein [Chloroflexota bacterium]